MQNLFQNYVSDLIKLRDAFHGELSATAEDLSKAMTLYAGRSEAALASFMEKLASSCVELEAAAAVRLNQFRGLRQTPVSQTTTTERSRVRQQMRISCKSQPPQSKRLRRVCKSKARAIRSAASPLDSAC